MTTTEQKKNKKPVLVDLFMSFIIPSVILSKFSGDEALGTKLALGVALLFPMSQFLWELIVKKTTNFISILGFISICLTGGIGFLELEPRWIAIKEAFFPALIGLAILASLKTRYPLVKKLIYNDTIIDTGKVHTALEANDKLKDFDKLLVKTSGLLAASFFLSSLLNYVLAKTVVVANPSVDPEAFNEQIGLMTAYSYPVIVVPSMIVLSLALWLLFKGLKKLTGLKLEEIFQLEKSK